MLTSRWHRLFETLPNMSDLTHSVETTFKDIRFAARSLARKPGTTLIALISIMLGIGANTAIFTLIDAVIWRMLPVKEPKSLVLFSHGQKAMENSYFSYEQFRLMRDQHESLTDLIAYAPLRLNVRIAGNEEPTADGVLVSGTFFRTLGVTPAIGRTIDSETDQVPNGRPVAMISHDFWKRRFAMSPTAIGRVISLSGTQFTIVGVTPPGFFGLEVGTSSDIYVPMMMQPAVDPASENLIQNPLAYVTWLHLLGRTKPGISMNVALAQLERPFRQGVPRFAKTKGAGNETLFVAAAGGGFSEFREDFTPYLPILMGAVVAVLLIACANLANLQLARAAVRLPEFAMRLALGASRWRLTREMLTESILLAAVGGAGGILLAYWMDNRLLSYISSGREPIVFQLEPNLSALVFTASLSIATGVLFGLAPALYVARVNLSNRIRGVGNALLRDSHGVKPKNALAVAQVALSLLLLISAGLFVRTLQHLGHSELGAAREKVLIIPVEPRGSDQRNISGVSERLDQIYKRLTERVSSIPGVASASLAQFTPTSDRGTMAPVMMQDGIEPWARMVMIYPKFFGIMGIPIIAGRDLEAADMNEQSLPVMLVNEAFARAEFPHGSPIGKPCLVPNTSRRPCTIIGVVKDSNYANLKANPSPTVYAPFLQTPTGRGQMALYVRINASSKAVAPLVRREVQKIDNDLPLFAIHSLAEQIDAALLQERLIASLSSFFSTLALLLAAVGIYGLLTFGVIQRSAEIGIRVALGALRGNILWMIVREAAALLGFGIGIGIPLAIAAVRVAGNRFGGLLTGLKTVDEHTIVMATSILIAVAAIAVVSPAVRALRVDPMTALRNE
jgi:predicted permease